MITSNDIHEQVKRFTLLFVQLVETQYKIIKYYISDGRTLAHRGKFETPCVNLFSNQVFLVLIVVVYHSNSI